MKKKKHVIITGAGPVGCVSALIIAKAGINVTLLEAEKDLPLDMRASTFHPPTLDMLDELGIVQEIINQGLITPKFQYRDRQDGLIAEFDMTAITDFTKHPYRVQAEQYKLTRIISDILKSYPHVDQRFHSKATNLQQDDSSVTVYFDSPGGPQSVQADYLISCDGSRSFARKTLEIGFPGFTYPELFMVVSTTDDITDVVPDMCPVAYITDPEEWCAVIRAPEMWRFLIPTDPEQEGYKVQCMEMGPTDMVCHNGYTWHYSGPNKKKGYERRGLSVRFIIQDAKFDPRPGQGAAFTKQLDLKAGDNFEGKPFPSL